MKINFNSKIGKFKPVNGASNFNSIANSDFFKLGFPTVRLHE